MKYLFTDKKKKNVLRGWWGKTGGWKMYIYIFIDIDSIKL